ncbi:hypothetical protein ABW19_dt0202019 [Dactylella cylindrospora]|nr:hypothetical protein ABW19_dt0202019 [Dactylella cylindrospora]
MPIFYACCDTSRNAGETFKYLTALRGTSALPPNKINRKVKSCLHKVKLNRSRSPSRQRLPKQVYICEHTPKRLHKTCRCSSPSPCPQGLSLSNTFFQHSQK